MLRRAFAFLLLLALGVAAISAIPLTRAEHTPEHRYYFVGVVETESGNPVCGITVRAYEEDSAGSPDRDRSAATDWSGHYEVQLHMHSGDEPEAQPPDVGKRVIVTVAGISQSVVLVKNAGNPNGWGQATIDFTVPDSVASPGLCMREVLLFGGAGAGTVVLIVGGVLYMRRPRARSGGRDLMLLPGMTRAKARELQGMGIRNRHELAEADPDEIAANTNLTAKQARLLVKRANEGKKN